MASPLHQTILSLAPDAVDRDEKGRIGIYFPLKAQALAHLIGQDGQHDPIKVRASTGSHKWKLVAGLHRLEACAIVGVEVKAIQVSGDARVIAEIQASENIHRRILCPIERACFIHAIGEAAMAQLSAAHGGKSQHEIAIASRWQKAKLASAINQEGRAIDTPDILSPVSNPQEISVSEAHPNGRVTMPPRPKEVDADTAEKVSALYGWQNVAARSLDMDVRSIQRDLALYRAIVAPSPAMAKALAKRDNPLNATELNNILRVPVENRPALIAFLIAHPGVISVDEALLHLKLRTKPIPPVGQTKFMNHFVMNFDRLSLSSQRQILPTIVERMTPGMRADIRKMIDEMDGAK